MAYTEFIMQLATILYEPIKDRVQAEGYKRSILMASSVASLATSVFRAFFMTKPKVQAETVIYGNTSVEIDQIEQSAYYGGMVNCFHVRPKGVIKHIDDNSLYPAAMKQISVSAEPATEI